MQSYSPGAPDATRQRLADALKLIGRHYEVPVPSVEQPEETLAFLAEALAAILIEAPAPYATALQRRKARSAAVGKG